MTSLKELEKLYHKAMEDAKLGDTLEGDSEPPGFSIEAFIRWAREVDIFTLAEGAADFALEQHEEIVQEFGEYRRNLTERLSKIFTYDDVPLPGLLKDIGSCWDGSKVGAVNEMDSLYVIQGDHFVVKENDNKFGLFHVYVRTDSTLREVRPRSIRDQFAHKYSQLVSEMKLPDCLQHGGHKTPRRSKQSKGTYSGVRYNGQAVTSQFLSKDKELLTWDMTPVIVSRSVDESQDVLRQSMQSIIADNTDKMFPPADVHLIPDATANLWRRSTAEIEADLLRVLSPEGPMKKALSSCKVLSSRVKEWNAKTQSVQLDPSIGALVEELCQDLSMAYIGKTAQELEQLSRKMRFGHIWIPAAQKEEYNEDKKSSISINNAAVKHILFKAACKRKGAFGPQTNMDLVRELITEVFETLADEHSLSSEHAFLPGVRISHLSVSASVAHKKHALARDICRQCRILVREAMTEVLYSHMYVYTSKSLINRLTVL